MCPQKIDVVASCNLSVAGPKCDPTKSQYADPGTKEFCPSSTSVHKADINGDGRMDLMCHGSPLCIISACCACMQIYDLWHSFKATDWFNW